MRSSWTNIHNIMLKLCLNPNYKQVLGELSQPVITCLNPRSPCAAHCCAQGFFSSWFSSTIIKCAWEKAYNTCSIWCTKFRHRLHDDDMHTSLACIEVWPTWRNITNAILYIGLMTWCHESLHLEKIPSWSRLKRAHYVSKPFDLLEITITFLLQLRKFW